MTAKTAQHTPGPWRISGAGYDDEVWGPGGLIADCLCNEANARLIAEAPRIVKGIQDARMVIGALRQYVPSDLLPNINGFLVYLGGLELDATGDCSHEGSGHSDEEALAAIAKAEGRE